MTEGEERLRSEKEGQERGERAERGRGGNKAGEEEKREEREEERREERREKGSVSWSRKVVSCLKKTGKLGVRRREV